MPASQRIEGLAAQPGDGGELYRMVKAATMIPIYSTRGDVDAILVYPHLYNRNGDWIGWVSAEREVFSVHGHYVGWISDDRRILRKLASNRLVNRRRLPSPPERITPPAAFPLAPLFAELSMGTIDVLVDCPETLPPLDFGDLRHDQD